MDVPEEEAAPVGGELTLLRVGARHPASWGSYCFIYMSTVYLLVYLLLVQISKTFLLLVKISRPLSTIGLDSSSVGPPGSGSVSQSYGSGSFYHQAKTVRKTLISTVFLLLYDFLS
jgi:hypothetical protein